MTNIIAKKRLMYLSREDFYLYSYSLFVILAALKCHDGKYFRDYRKLPFLIDIIGDIKTVYIVNHALGKKLNPKDHEHLLDSYSNGLTRRSEALKLLFALEKRGYIFLERGAADEINVSLNLSKLPEDFLNDSVFESEFKNISQIGSKIKRLASLTLETMLSKIYVENGVRSWA